VAREGCVTSYREVTELAAIRAAVRAAGAGELEELEVLVTVACTRQRWALGGLAVVVDRMEDGYSVGEVEAVVQAAGRGEAARRVRELAARLGLRPLEEGKVEHCLRVQRPEVLQALRELRAQPSHSAPADY
jgi:hypothetical protein